MANIIEFSDLSVDFHRIGESSLELIHGISMQFPKGEITGIVGESGSGKSITMKAVLDLLTPSVKANFSELNFDGKSILPVKNRHKLPIAMIFQDPLTSLNPVRTIGFHLREVILRFEPHLRKHLVKEKMVAELDAVGIVNPEQCLSLFPHELSGGMRQRVMIAMALLKKPQLLIADEPTTALDVTIQAQILKLLKKRQQEENLSVILVTHDFSVIAEMCDTVKVMYKGHLIEEAPVREIFDNPKHPYTQELIKAIPTGKNRERLYTMDYAKIKIDQTATHKMVEISPHHSVLKEG